MPMAKLTLDDLERELQQAEDPSSLYEAGKKLVQHARAIEAERKDKPLVELWSVFWGDALFICRHDTGVLYTNQVGGTCCSHPTIEGFAIPIRVQQKEELSESLYDECECDEFDWDDMRSRTQKALVACGLDLVFEPLSDANRQAFLADIKSNNQYGPDRIWLAEAWLPVQVRADIDDPVGYGRSTPDKWPNHTALKDLAGRWGVLTWENSD